MVEYENTSDVSSAPQTSGSSLLWVVIIVLIVGLIAAIIGVAIWFSKTFGLGNGDQTCVQSNLGDWCTPDDLKSHINAQCLPGAAGSNTICKDACNWYYKSEEDESGVPLSGGQYTAGACKYFWDKKLPCGVIQNSCMCTDADVTTCSDYELFNSSMTTSASATCEDEICMDTCNELSSTTLTNGLESCGTYASSSMKNKCKTTPACACGFTSYEDRTGEPDPNEPYFGHCLTASAYNTPDGKSGLYFCEMNESELHEDDRANCYKMCEHLFEQNKDSFCDNSDYLYCHEYFPPCRCPIDQDFESTKCNTDELIYLTDYYDCT